MAFCRSSPSEAGFATPAALVIALSIALLASGLLARSAGDLRAARYDFQRVRAEGALNGAQLVAASAIVSSQTEGPYRWETTSDLGRVEITAELEASKLSASAAAGLSDNDLLIFGVKDPASLRLRLSEAAALRGHVMISDLDPALGWRLCAPSIISLFGEADTPRHLAAVEPGPGPSSPSWHVGEVWFVAVATSDGWRDNRIIRFTGDARRPAATVTRRFFRTTTSGEQLGCEEMLSALAAG